MRFFTNRFHISLLGLALGACIWTSPLSYAQEPGPPPPPDDMGPPPGMSAPKMNVDKEIARMTKRYALSDTQKSQIRPILIEEQNKMDALFKDDSLAPEDRFAKMRAIHEEQVARISAVLSDTQREKYQKDQQRMNRPDGPDGPDGPPPPPPGDAGGGPSPL